MRKKLIVKRGLGSNCHCYHNPFGGLGAVVDTGTLVTTKGLNQYTQAQIDEYLMANTNFKDYFSLLNSFLANVPDASNKLNELLNSNPIILQVLVEGMDRGLQVEQKKQGILDRMKQNLATMGIVFVKEQANKYCDKFLDFILAKLGSAGTFIKNTLKLGKSVAEATFEKPVCEFAIDQGIEVLGEQQFLSSFEDWLGVELITNDAELKTMQYGTVPAEKTKISQAVSALRAGVEKITTPTVADESSILDRNKKLAFVRNVSLFDPRIQQIADLQKKFWSIREKQILLDNISKVKKVMENQDQTIVGNSDNDAQKQESAFNAKNIGIGLLVVALGVGIYYSLDSE